MYNAATTHQRIANEPPRYGAVEMQTHGHGIHHFDVFGARNAVDLELSGTLGL
jgi:hypothetical protein